MEYIDVLDENGYYTGKTIQRGEPLNEGEYHLSVHAYIVNNKGSFLMQKRSNLKEYRPLEWDFTGGTVISGEDSKSAIRREIFEELGIRIIEENLYYLFSIKRKNVLIDVYCYFTNKELSDLTLQSGEVSLAKYVTKNGLLNIARKNLNNSYRSFDKVLKAIELIDNIQKKVNTEDE